MANRKKKTVLILGTGNILLKDEGLGVKAVEAFKRRCSAEKTISVIKQNILGRDAAIIGRVVEEPAGKVLLETPIGNKRVLGMLSGEQLPRIC